MRLISGEYIQQDLFHMIIFSCIISGDVLQEQVTPSRKKSGQ